MLRVSDLQASADWYTRVLCLAESSRYTSVPGAGQVVLEYLASGLTLCLVCDGAPFHRFNEHMLGLDHLEFLVPSVEELSRWTRHLDALRVSHSGIKEPSYSRSAMVTFRDPDNIQLELFCVHR